jgi:hypothetical protein
VVVLVVLPLLMLGALMQVWASGDMTWLGIGGYLPISDALGYLRCAVGIVDIGGPAISNVVDPDWCTRRIVYPSALASLLWLLDWRASWILVGKALLIGFAIALAAIAIARRFGWIAAVLTVLGLAVFAREFALGSFTTEAFGLPAGLVAFALLLPTHPDRMPSRRRLIAGCVLLSVAMVARMGALFALPAVGLWLAVHTWRGRTWTQRLGLWGACALGLASGFILQWLLVRNLGFSATNTGSNFATSLYGLSTGTRDWADAYKQFEEVFRTQPERQAFALVQRAAVDNIIGQPSVFLTSLFWAGDLYGRTLFHLGTMVPLKLWLSAAYGAGMLLCLWRWRDPAFCLLFALAAGEAMSGPLVIDSGGTRVFAATIVARYAVAACAVGLGLATVFAWVRRSKRVPAPEAVTAGDGLANVAVAAGATVVLILVVLPVSGVFALRKLPQVAVPAGCAPGEVALAADMRRETLRLRMGERQLPIVDERLSITSRRLQRGAERRPEWWTSALPHLPDGDEIIYIFRRDPPQTALLAVVLVDGAVKLPARGTVGVCLAPDPLPQKAGDFLVFRAIRALP